ncbi:MAG TPA: hypothetical protein VEQ63_16480 [Bryobacteraceae bacterium]|nr:hypothetical protein [Bryobacteraceae bacterium]
MNTGWNYRREHLGLSQRSHYVIVNGGSQPNVVPSEASVWYYFRERSYEGIKGLHEIGSTIARAAAQMTGTSVEERVLAATWPGHFSVPIAEAANRNISRVGLPSWSEDDQKFAKAVQTLMGAPTRGLAAKLLPERAGEGGEGGPSGEPGRAAAAGAAGSDDIAEVSWNVPTIQLRYPGNISGAIGHHWSSAMAMATPIAHKGATAGAKVHAMNALDLLLNPELMKAAKEYFDKQTKETKWQSLIPAGVQPYLDMHKERMEKYRPEMRKYYFDSSKYGTYLEQLGIKYPMLDAPKQP